MAIKTIRFMLLAWLVFALGGAAAAADLPEDDYAPAPPVEPAPPQPALSNWYIRGDAAYTFRSQSGGHYYGWDAAHSHDLPEFDYDQWTLRWRGDVDAGIGYQFNDHLRADATVGYWQRDVEGRATSPFHCLGLDPDDVSCRFTDRGKIRAWEVMANLYYDFFHYGLFTPYAGAGLGFARLKTSQLTNEATCVDADGEDVEDCGYVGHHTGRSSTRFAWALMAGTAVDVTDRLKLDLGYRYARLEGGDMFGWDADDRAAGATGTQSFDHGYSMHQIRAGLRVGF